MVFLKSQELLLVLDNCEHVIEAAANLAEDIFKGAPGVHILATSREPLRAAGERVHRLPPLESAPLSANLTAAEALKFAGIQLFVDRASAVSDAFELTDADAPIIADICRRLDGIPLAIELAAGRIDAFGVRGLAERLDDRFRLLTSGRRTALPRHQTLSATLDWSFELLPVSEKTALRRLGIFAGDFSLTSAAAVTSELGVDRQRAATLAVRDKTKALEHGSAARWGRPRGCRHSCHALPTAALQNRHNRWLGSSLSSGPR